MAQEDPPEKERANGPSTTDINPAGIGVGVALGLIFGVVFDNVALGLMLGVALGVAVGAGMPPAEARDDDA